MSFICMYKDYQQGIAAATDGYESIRNSDGTYTRKNTNACKLIYDKEKELLLTFCGIMEYHGIRIEERIRTALCSYKKGDDIRKLFQDLDQQLLFLEDSTGYTDIFIGYFGENRLPCIGVFEYHIIAGEKEVWKKITLDAKRKVIAAGTHIGIVNGLENYYYPDIQEQAVKTVSQAIALDTLKPEAYRTVGGEIQSALLKI